MIGTEQNIRQTEEESRTYRSQFEVSFILPINAFVVCSTPLSFFFSKLTMNTDKEKTLWAKYLKLKN